MEPMKPDLCIIGAGAGGLAVATAAAVAGAAVVLIERNRLGGNHLNSGDVPSQALRAVARRADTLRRAASFGLKPQRVAVDYRQVRAHIRETVAALAANASAARLTGLGIRVIAGAARFEDERTAVVEDRDIAITARRFVVATGAATVLPPIPGLADTPHVTSETIFDLASLPKHLVVMGAGATGLELAQTFRRLGSEVTVLEAAQPLAGEDAECVQVVLNQLARDGITLRAGVRIASVSKLRTRITVNLASDNGEASESIDGTHLLIATGRRPVIDGLGLDAARIRTEAGAIAVDERMRTSNRRVYAIGDVLGGPQFTHRAMAQAAAVVRHAVFRTAARLPDTIPRILYTDPELAQIGLTEVVARREHKHLRILRWPFRDNDRARIEGDTTGHVKVVAAPNGRILGVTIVGAGAADTIALWRLAMERHLDVSAASEFILAYPTVAEAGRNAAASGVLPRLTSPFVRRIIAPFRWFG